MSENEDFFTSKEHFKQIKTDSYQFLFITVLQRHSLDGVDHRDQSVGSGRREILLKTYLVDESEIVRGDLFRCADRIEIDQKGDNAFRDDSVAVGLEPKFSVLQAPIQPNPGLTSLNQLILSLFRLRIRLQILSQVDEILVFVEPFIVHREIVNHRLFSFL